MASYTRYALRYALCLGALLSSAAFAQGTLFYRSTTFGHSMATHSSPQIVHVPVRFTSVRHSALPERPALLREFVDVRASRVLSEPRIVQQPGFFAPDVFIYRFPALPR